MSYPGREATAREDDVMSDEPCPHPDADVVIEEFPDGTSYPICTRCGADGVVSESEVEDA